MDVKQVIVMRTDLNMRKGKMIAQGAHAAMAWLTLHGDNLEMPDQGQLGWTLVQPVTHVQGLWLRGQFTKICVRVDSEVELQTIAAKAQEAGLTVSLIQDAGLTEFGGVPTFTCCAIGPDLSEDIDKITGELRLL